MSTASNGRVATLDAATSSTQGTRWFALALRFFVAGAVIAAGAALLLWLPQMRVLAAVGLVQALLGVGVCMWGLHGSKAPRADSAAPHPLPRPKDRWSLRRLTHMILPQTRKSFMS